MAREDCARGGPTEPLSKRWRIMLRARIGPRGEWRRLYRGPFDTYAEAVRARTDELASGKWDEGWVYEALRV